MYYSTRVLESSSSTFSDENSKVITTNPMPIKPEELDQANIENIPPEGPVFAGQLQNCTFNFYT